MPQQLLHLPKCHQIQTLFTSKMLLPIVFVIGLVIGSFLNVCIYRIPRNEEIVYTPSHCMTCGKPVKWYDLFPVVSWLALGGKCRHCKTKLSKQYPIIELFNGAAYLGIFYYLGLSWQALAISFLFSTLLVITMIDLSHQIIPNKILIFLFLISLPYVIFISKSYVESIIGFFAASSFLYLVAVLSKGQMGGGDIKLMAVGGFIIGWKNILLSLMLGSIIGAIVGITLISTGVVKKKQLIPFGPYLASGIMIAAVFGDQLIHWYWSLFIL